MAGGHRKEERKGKMKKAEKIIIWVLPIVIFAAFLCYAMLSPRAGSIAVITGAVSVFLFTAFLLRGARNVLNFFRVGMYNRRDELIGERTAYHMHPKKAIFIRSLIAQPLIIFLVYLIFTAVNGYSGTAFSKYSAIFMQQNVYGIGIYANAAWDKLSLIPVPELWNELLALIGINNSVVTTVIAFAVNSVLVSLVCVMLYEVLLLDCDRRTSMNGVMLLFISPTILYLMMPNSGTAAMMLLSLMFIFYMKTSHPVKGLICMLAAITVNVLCAVLLVPFILFTVKLIVKRRGSAAPIAALCIGTVMVAGACALIASGVVSVPAAKLIYPDGFRWFFEGLSAAVTRWNASPSTSLQMFFAIGAQIIALLLLILCARRVDAATNMLMAAWLALTPMAFSDPSMAVYAVCICPALPILTAASAKTRTQRLIVCAIMLAAFVLFASLIFAYRLV